MKEELRVLLMRLIRVFSEPAFAHVGPWKLKVRAWYFVVILFPLVAATSWHSIAERTGNGLAEGYGEYGHQRDRDRNGSLPSKGQRIDVSGCVRMGGWSSFTDEETGSDINNPTLFHDPSTGHVFLAYNVYGKEGIFHAYYSPKGKETKVPARWSDKEVRAFIVLFE